MSADLDAALVFTRSDGWHLQPSPELEQVCTRTSRAAPAPRRQRSEPTSRALPTLGELPTFLDALNASLRREQGYPS